jgi:hypothetical protein
MTDLVADLKRLRLYGMAACYAEGLEHGQPLMTTATALLAQLVQAEATDRATRSIRYQMHVARFPVHRDLAGFEFDQAKVDRRQIHGYATTTFTDTASACASTPPSNWSTPSNRRKRAAVPVAWRISSCTSTS